MNRGAQRQALDQGRFEVEELGGARLGGRGAHLFAREAEEEAVVARFGAAELEVRLGELGLALGQDASDEIQALTAASLDDAGDEQPVQELLVTARPHVSA
jgi:hypothetical protein